MGALGIDWKILIGQLINFAILFFLLKKFAYKPFLDVLEKRRVKIEEGINNSKEAEMSLGKIRGERKDILEKGEKEARDMIIKAEATAALRAGEILALAEEEKKKMAELSKREIEKELAEQKNNREKEIIETTLLLAEKFLKEKINPAKDEELIRGFISSMKAKQ
ncbi:MAG: F0F1 ATP synthase subunit B [Candidatus Wildermuthbacteria bacterium]|nr:F0F1 ATP synthase subunit B [Candidatus Wildermuthbacteria bacterium]